MSKKELLKRYILLVVGVFLIGLGIAVSKHSNLGISPISSLANVLSLRFDFFTIGNWLMCTNCLFILVQVAILKKKFGLIQLLQFPISLLLGVFTDIGVWAVSAIPAEGYAVKLIFVLIGMLILALGITLTVISDTVMNVGEALVDVIARVTGRSFGGVKVVFDVSCVASAVLLSLIFFDFTVQGVREGTVITACCTGFVVKWLTGKMKEPVTNILKK